MPVSGRLIVCFSTVFYDDSDPDTVATESLKRHFKPTRHLRADHGEPLLQAVTQDKRLCTFVPISFFLSHSYICFKCFFMFYMFF